MGKCGWGGFRTNRPGGGSGSGGGERGGPRPIAAASQGHGLFPLVRPVNQNPLPRPSGHDHWISLVLIYFLFYFIVFVF